MERRVRLIAVEADADAASVDTPADNCAGFSGKPGTSFRSKLADLDAIADGKVLLH